MLIMFLSSRGYDNKFFGYGLHNCVTHRGSLSKSIKFLTPRNQNRWSLPAKTDKRQCPAPARALFGHELHSFAEALSGIPYRTLMVRWSHKTSYASCLIPHTGGSGYIPQGCATGWKAMNGNGDENRSGGKGGPRKPALGCGKQSYHNEECIERGGMEKRDMKMRVRISKRTTTQPNF